MDNGKPIRESIAADLPLVIDHYRYFAGVIRAEEGEVVRQYLLCSLLSRCLYCTIGTISELDSSTVSICLHEPLGVVGQIIPWNFPLLMAAWKVAPALAAGNCVVLKPAEQTPTSIMVWFNYFNSLVPMLHTLFFLSRS